MVDDSSFHGEIAGRIDTVRLDSCLLLVWGIGRVSFERSVGGVLIHSHHINRRIRSLIEEDLVAMLDNDNVPGVDASSSAHEHRQDVGGGEDTGFILLGKGLHDWIVRSGHIVGCSIEMLESSLGVLDRRLVEGSVVVVEGSRTDPHLRLPMFPD